MPYNNGYGVNELSNTGTTNLYFRLEVDTLQWDGTPICSSATCAQPDTGTAAYESANDQSTAHKGYAVQLATPGTIICGSTLPSPPCSSSTMSAMGDMTVFTPIETGGSAASFSIPLFKLDPSYANQTIDVYVFDPGDVNYNRDTRAPPTWASRSRTEPGRQPASSRWELHRLGGGTGPVGSAWPTIACGSGKACFQTATASGSIYNGQWLKLEINVPSSVSNWSAYWNLVYYVSPYAQAGDTFAVQVGFAGSPDRLLPEPRPHKIVPGPRGRAPPAATPGRGCTGSGPGRPGAARTRSPGSRPVGARPRLLRRPRRPDCPSRR